MASSLLRPLLLALAAVAAAPLTILPVGDSITYGCGDSIAYVAGDSCVLNSTLVCSGDNNTLFSGYRGLLYSLLVNSGVDVRMVGPYRNGHFDELPEEAHGNAAFSGASIGPSANGWDLMTMFETWAAPAYRSVDVITLLIGTNDLWIGNSATKTLELYEGLLVRMHATFKPTTRTLVSTSLDMTTITWPADINETWAGVNAGLPPLVSKLAAAGMNVALVDIHAETSLCPRLPRNNSLCCRAYNVHPSDAGYARVAEAWFGAIVATGAARRPLNSPRGSDRY